MLHFIVVIFEVQIEIFCLKVAYLHLIRSDEAAKVGFAGKVALACNTVGELTT